MSISKVLIIVGASIVTAGSSAAAATRDKWWPKNKEAPATDSGNSEVASVPGAVSPSQPPSASSGPGG